MTATTTYSAIRLWAESRLDALVPAVSSDVPFARARGEVDLEAWAAKNPAACLRRYQLLRSVDLGPPPVSDLESQQVTVPLLLLVAYPGSWQRYGVDGSVVDLHDAVDSDRRLILGRDGVAVEAYADYPAGLHAIVCLAHSVLELAGGVFLSSFDLRATYYEAIT